MRVKISHLPILLAGFALLFFSCDRDPVQYLQLVRVRVGDAAIYTDNPNEGVPFSGIISVEFNNTCDTLSVPENIILTEKEGDVIPLTYSYSNEIQTILLSPIQPMSPAKTYSLELLDGLKGTAGEVFPGVTYQFSTEEGSLKIESVTLNGSTLSGANPLRDISYKRIQIEIQFSDPLDPSNYSSFFSLSGSTPLSFNLSDDNRELIVSNRSELEDYKKYYFNISENLTSAEGYIFSGYSASFHTALDSSYKFQEIPDDELLELVQRQAFRYFYDFAHPVSGMARERNTSGEVVTTGGSGFGLMALVAGIEREFITRDEGIAHFEKVVDFLESCDRFHGAWPHWLNGSTGSTYPFSQKDNGADLVETAFLVQGLLTVRQYLNTADAAENALSERINALWEAVEWDWFTKGGEEVLYWHWSPDYNWDMNMQIRGYNEALMVYILAAASPTHPVEASVYHNGWARNGGIVNGRSFYGITLPLGYDYGGPLFFAHYSFLGLDPRKLSDQYGNYWEQNVAHALINRNHAITNPLKYVGYSSDCWGLTASDGNGGYSAHSPTNDRGVISPTAAVSSIAFTPDESMDAIRHFYYLLGDRLWGEYGFYDAFNVTAGWWANSYIAIDKGPEIVMIENYRSGLLWNLFMSAPEVGVGLDKLGFSYGN